MRYAIISDLHANLTAWNAVLADLREQGVDVVVCLGDVVGYGPKPAEVLKGVRSVTNNFVMGNHDAAAVGKMDYSIFNEHARQAIEWTMTEMDSEDKKFLSSVPLGIEAGEILFVHAEICEPGRFHYILDTNIAKENFEPHEHLVTFIGHTHLPKIFERDKSGEVIELPDKDKFLELEKRYIVNVGSVGEPRDPEDLRARYVIYDSKSREVIFRRVEFDIASYRKDLESTSLILRPYFLRVYEEVIEGKKVISSYGNGQGGMQLSHNSSALADQGKVVNLSVRGELLKSAQPSRAPATVMFIAAFLTLTVLGFWILPNREKSIPAPTAAEAKPEPKERDIRGVKNSPVVLNKSSPNPSAEDIVKIPDKVKLKPKPKTKPKRKTSSSKITKLKGKPKSKPKPKPEPIPEPVPEVTSDLLQFAWWRMGDGKDTAALVDQGGQVSLIQLAKGKTIRALAPDPVPKNLADNGAAKQLGIWQEERSENHFVLSADHSFTFEGWFLIGSFKSPVFLFGTRSGQDDDRGWHLDLRPQTQRLDGQSMSFFYDSGKKKIQALAEDLQLTDGKAHHFAIVWDHDKTADEGDMIVYLDGKKVVSANLLHSEISGEQFHPFRVGADFNPSNLGLDELKFTRKALEPHEFLLREKIQNNLLVKADGRVTDSWSVAENWESGSVPSGAQHAIIGPDLKVQISKSKPPEFAGSLVLREKASLRLWSPDSEAVISKTNDRLIMHEDSKLILGSNEDTQFGRIELTGKGSIYGGFFIRGSNTKRISIRGHHTKRIFASKISGPGQLVLNGISNNTMIFKVANTFAGGLNALSIANNQKFKVIAEANQCFGTGPFIIGSGASLHLQKGLEDTIADDAVLTLIGVTGSLPTKLVLDSDETVGRFVVDGDDQGKGTFNKTSHPKIIGGEGTLRVK